MKHNKGVYDKLKAVLLLTTFLFTLSINSLHFVIFTHEHSCDHEHDTKTDISFNKSESHSICQWNFAKSDSNRQVISHIFLDFTHIEFKYNKYSPEYSKVIRLYSLRAPPYYF